MKKILTAVTAALLAGSSMASLISYESTISNPTDGGGGPALWFKNATTKSGEHMLNSGSAGDNSSTHQAYRLGGTLYTDLWGNENMAFGSTNATEPAVAGSTDLFTTGAQGTISFLFNTGSSIGSADVLFSQGNSFAVKLIGTTSTLRISHVNDGTKYVHVGDAVTTDTWYFFSMKWDTSKTGDDLTWYLGAANGSLQSGTLTIAAAGENTSIGLGQSKDPMQEIAIWERELSDASIQAQFDAIPEPATLGLFGLAASAVLLLRRMTR